MNSKLIEAQIEAQALAEAWRASIVEAQAQRLKAEAQQATYETAQNHCDRLRVEVEKANERLVSLHEKTEGQRMLANLGRPS